MATTIRQRTLANGLISISLDHHYYGKRKSETLNIYLKPPLPQNALYNKERLRLAEIIRVKRHEQMLCDKYGLVKVLKGSADFLKFIETESSDRNKTNRHYRGLLKHLKLFTGRSEVCTTQINGFFVDRFYTYLQSVLAGETPRCYIKTFKKLTSQATKEGLFTEDPATGIRCRKFISHEKEVLSFDELKILVHTECINEEVKEAFLFSCFTGLRYSDVRKATNSTVSGNRMTIVQQKTSRKVTIVLSNDALKLLHHRRENAGAIFCLPSYVTCLKYLKKWVNNAGINKNISWHCSRHSFGTNLIAVGVDIYTVAKSMGHNSVKHSERYLRENMALREQAINKIPDLLPL